MRISLTIAFAWRLSMKFFFRWFFQFGHYEPRWPTSRPCPYIAAVPINTTIWKYFSLSYNWVAYVKCYWTETLSIIGKLWIDRAVQSKQQVNENNYKNLWDPVVTSPDHGDTIIVFENLQWITGHSGKRNLLYFIHTYMLIQNRRKVDFESKPKILWLVKIAKKKHRSII